MNKKVFNEKFFSQHNIKDMNKINYPTQKIILENNKMNTYENPSFDYVMTSEHSLRTSFLYENKKWKGGNTKAFIKYNKQQLKKGLTNVIAYDKSKIYNELTKRIVNKNTYFTNKGKIRAQYKKKDLLINNDRFVISKDYVRNIKKDIRNAEKTNNRTNIKINNQFIKRDLTKLLDILKPKLRKYVLAYNEGDNGNDKAVDGYKNYFSLTNENIKRLKTILNDKGQGGEIRGTESDAEFIEGVAPVDFFDLIVLPKGKKSIIDGGFFPYYHKLNTIDLKKYQIFKVDDENEKYNLNCLCYSLIKAGIDISKIKHLVRNQDIPQRLLDDVAYILNIYITIKRVEANGHIRKYGNPDNELVELGIIENHYFLIEKTNYTKYSIENYNDIYNEKDFNKIIGVQEKNGKKYFKRAERFISSFDLIRLLCSDKEKYLQEIKYNQKLYKSDYHNQIKDYGILEYNNTLYCKKNNPTGNLKKNEPSKRDCKFDKILKFDFETTTQVSREETERKILEGKKETEHKPYMVYTHEHKEGFWGRDCGKKLLNDLISKYGRTFKYDKEIVSSKPVFIDQNGIEHDDPFTINLIAHNSTYDFRFIQEYLYGIKTIEKGNSLVVAEGCYWSYNKKMIKVVITDSWKMISMPLKNFKKTFKLKTKKEIMPYELYNEINVAKRYISLKECLTYLKIDERNEFIENCKLWNCLEDDDVDILKYAGEYCYMDCVVLHQGYEKFRELVIKALGLDIYKYLTIASLSDDYLKIQGCYDDVYMLSGVPRAFIQECVVGGRTMMRANTPSKMLNSVIADFDAVSLYPSAMARMEGFLRGTPKVIKDHNDFYKNINKWNGYFIEIKITELNKKRLFPLQSIVNDEGIRNFTNDIVGKNIFIDKTGLEDLQEFQDVKYEFIKGYYYNEGFNKNVNKTIKFLFNKRIEMKKIGSPLQMVYKLAMNSSYGKSLLKPIDTDVEYIRKEDTYNYIERNFNYIKEGKLLADKKYMKFTKIKLIDNHFNNVHIGVSILSMSKRIMNEVMCLGEDLKLNMYYQDTDSIHIDNHSVPILAEEFKKKYNKDLIGKGMGQFHTDFDMDNACGEIIAKNSIFLGKKCYIDELESKDKDGNIINDYHIRMKGIPNDCILHKAKELNITPFDIFNFLYDNNLGIDFNLVAVKPKFEMRKNMTIRNRLSFDRKIKFDCSNGILNNNRIALYT